MRVIWIAVRWRGNPSVRPRWALISRVSGGRRERTSRSLDNSGYKRKNMENKEKRRNKKKN
jgi:hypothetical protein